MAVRIYAFAKELGIDNKDLLDICEKLGIKGKGSALASLDDDEIARIKKQIATSQTESSPAVAAPIRTQPVGGNVVPERPPILDPRRDDSRRDDSRRDDSRREEPRRDDSRRDEPRREELRRDETSRGDMRPVRVPPLRELTDLQKKRQIEEPEKIAEPVSLEPAAASGTPGTAPGTPTRPVAGPIATNEPRREIRSERRFDPPKELQSLTRRDKDKDGRKEPRKDPRKRPAINVALADMPNVKQPSLTVPTVQEKVQKPDIALPQDVLRKHRVAGPGESPLTQYTKQKRELEKPKKPKGKPGELTPPVVADAGGAGILAHKSRPKREKGDGTPDVELGSTRQTRGKKREKDVNMLEREDERLGRRRGPRKKPSKVSNTAAPRKEKVVLNLPCTVRSFSEVAGVSAVQVLLTLPKIGEPLGKNINSELSQDSVELLLDHFKIHHVEIKAAESLEDLFELQLQADAGESDRLEPRPPIVTFLGHVDHGKTSLLDAIIGTDVVSGEAGGITQHIRAYQVNKDGKKIAFVDTPGHEAFTEMRARGANVTDIAVLVIAADDGVMPQTEEAISHAKAAKVPIIVAMNKVDLPGANVDKVYQDLAANDLLPSAWGGEVEVIPTSALKKTGINELLETILVTAELHELQADPHRPAFGTCLEAEQESGRGVIAKVMVQGGTLSVGDVILCGSTFGRVKAMYDTLKTSKRIETAGPSTPVNLTGLETVPQAGDKFHVLKDIPTARQLAISREDKIRQTSLGGTSTRVSLEQFQQLVESGTLGKSAELITLNLIIRADVRGSIEAIQKELGKIEHPEVRINILQALVGGVTIADVRLAQASQAVIIGFNVVPDEAARSLAEELQVQIRRYDIIYKVADDIKATLEGRLKPEEQVVEMGMAMVLQTFSISRTGMVAGCRVMRGTVHRDCRMRLVRDSRVIGEYEIESLKREKDDAKEVQRGMECGIKLANFNDIKEGDTLEAFKIEQVARSL